MISADPSDDEILHLGQKTSTVGGTDVSTPIIA